MKSFSITFHSMVLVSAMLISCLLSGGCRSDNNTCPTNKKELMDAFVSGTLDPSYVPAAFFVHFPNDAKTGEKAVNAHLQFFLKTNADILKVQFEQVQARIPDLDKQQTWDEFEPIPVDFFRPTVEIIKEIVETAGKDVYVLPTVYSPYQVARQALTDEGIARAAVERMDDLKRVFGYYAAALEWFVDECKKVGVEGFYMTTQGGEMKYNDIPGFFDELIKPNDLRVMNRCQEGSKLTILHICDWEGTYDDLTRYVDYPGDIVNTPNNLNGIPFTLKDGEKLFNRPVLGGLERTGRILDGTPEEIAGLTRQAIAEGPERMMIGAECTVSTAPVKNIHAAIYTAHHSNKR